MKMLLSYGIVGALGLAYLYFVTCEYVAHRCAERGDFACALRLQPGNADYYRQSARQRLFAAADYPLVIADLDRALELNHSDATSWMDLADAYFALGDKEKVKDSVTHAISLDATTPAIHWRAATYLLAGGDVDQAKSQMRLAVQQNRHLSYEAIRVSYAVDHNDRDVFDVLPHTRFALAEALHFFIHKDEVNGAMDAWRKFHSSELDQEPSEAESESIPVLEWRHAKALVDFLLGKNEFAKAASVWHDVCTSSPRPAYCDSSNSAINGSFEEPLLDLGGMAGFDWRILTSNVQRDPVEFFDGQYALQIDFPATTTDQSYLMQWLDLRPNTRFVVHAMYKSEMRAGANVELQVEDASGKPLGKGGFSSGRGPWTELAFPFETGTVTDGSKLRLKSTGPVDGRIWIDAIRVTPEPLPTS